MTMFNGIICRGHVTEPFFVLENWFFCDFPYFNMLYHHWGGTDVVTRVTTSLNGGQLSHFATSEASFKLTKAVMQYISFQMAGEFCKDLFFALV